MKKSNTNLSPNELIIMELFWEHPEPLTSVDIAEYITEWRSAYLNNLLSSLQKKGMLEVVGIVQMGKHYVRKFLPVYTKEQYAASLLDTLNIGKKSVLQIALAMAKDISKNEEEEIVSELEGILAEFKKEKGIE